VSYFRSWFLWPETKKLVIPFLRIYLIASLYIRAFEDHVWFEDRWMVASWCDEWFTTLCGLILGYVLQVQVAAWLVLVQVKNKCERSLLWGLQVCRRQVGFVRGTRWPVGSSTGRMVARTARWSRWTISWLSHKTKVEPGLRGSQVMSGDWWRLHQVCGVCGGWPENHRVTRLSHKAEAEYRAWLSGQNRHDRFGVGGRWKLQNGGHASGSQGLRRGYVKCGRRASDGVMKTNSQSALGGHVSQFRP
jgi:hypothetical protein